MTARTQTASASAKSKPCKSKPGQKQKLGPHKKNKKTRQPNEELIKRKPEMISFARIRLISAEFAVSRYAESRCADPEIESSHAPLLSELEWGVRMGMLTIKEYEEFRKKWQSVQM